ncbi:MAG: hypothetical protein Ct9H300mP1_10980 [Planctomycetaceae bacterium]|nr:MAG: hypothetical protein Ct9H300mP1_10980 [Planctomycetaceae bacterium]
MIECERTGPHEDHGDAWDVAHAAFFLASDEARTSPAPNWSSMGIDVQVLNRECP